jgi:hypothetical protein
MNLNYLAGRDRRLAKYFLRLAEYREISADFAEELSATGQASIRRVEKACARLAGAEEVALRDLMEPLAAVAAATGYSLSRLRQIVREHGPSGDYQIRAEIRGRDWWLLRADVALMLATGELRGPVL